MNAKANHVVCTWYHEFVKDCSRISAIQREKEKLYDGYKRYRGLLREEEETRDRLIKSFGILGKYSPGFSEGTAKLLWRIPLNSSEVRRELRIWEILELFLSVKDDKVTVNEFQGFLSYVEIDASAQAIDSAIKSHPELFAVTVGNSGKTIQLKSLNRSVN